MQSPLLGFNNNVRHRGRLFHIQTEDSGVRHPHVITHLFMDGGRILKTIKTSYAEHVGTDRMAAVVRDLMKDQHKAMFIALRDGQFDRTIEGEDASKSGERPTSGRAPGPASPVDGEVVPSINVPPNQVTLTPAAPVAASQPRPPSSPPPAPPKGSDSALARGALRREAPDLYAAPEGDAVSVVTQEARQANSDAPTTPAKERSSSGRYAASRPAAIFTTSRPPEDGGSLFGNDIVNEKSLDEVILSYISDDLEEKTEKKK